MDILQDKEILLYWFTVASAIGLFLSILLVPWIITQIPADYFLHKKRKEKTFFIRHPLIKVMVLILRNLFGIVLILAGIIMLFIPGQGVISIITGIILTDFPYKYRLEQWIISQPKILQTINTLRRKAGKEALILDHVNR